MTTAGHTKIRKPCANCPWRKDAPRQHWAPDHFESIALNCRDDGMHVMLCHKAKRIPAGDRSAPVCQGWIRVLGFEAIGVRIAAFTGRITLEEVEDQNPPELFASFEEMLDANDITPPRRSRNPWSPR